jgi:hypothetical protein
VKWLKSHTNTKKFNKKFKILKFEWKISYGLCDLMFFNKHSKPISAMPRSLRVFMSNDFFGTRLCYLGFTSKERIKSENGDKIFEDSLEVWNFIQSNFMFLVRHPNMYTALITRKNPIFFSSNWEKLLIVKWNMFFCMSFKRQFKTRLLKTLGIEKSFK